MFKTNTAHQQTSLLGVHQLLPDSRRKKLENSHEALFYELIFRSYLIDSLKLLESQIQSKRT